MSLGNSPEIFFYAQTKTFGFDLLHLWPASDDMEFLPWKQIYRAYLARDKQQLRVGVHKIDIGLGCPRGLQLPFMI